MGFGDVGWSSRLATVVLLLATVQALAAPPDEGLIARITGLEPEVKAGVVKVSVPRTALTVTVDGVRMDPFQGLTSWAAFQASGEAIIVMGDLALAEDEVDPAMTAALANGLAVTALHNHFAFDHPRILFMHIDGTGTTERLATAIRKTLDAVQQVRRTPSPAESFGGPAIPDTSTIEPKPLEAILGRIGQAKNGMVKFVFERKTTMHGAEMGATMGVSTWAVFAGSPESAVVDGDFAMLETEVQGVLKALRAAGIHIVALHSHMLHEQPRILFLHYWGKGPEEGLARALKKAMATQRK
ncbi:MAG: DUF1259 domain-containing protein [Deltaproteobacteria bacterium]|nr:MAG: DUF1259 domain-containing protein [Deltaproteobacteria bacterium]